MALVYSKPASSKIRKYGAHLTGVVKVVGISIRGEAVVEIHYLWSPSGAPLEQLVNMVVSFSRRVKAGAPFEQMGLHFGTHQMPGAAKSRARDYQTENCCHAVSGRYRRLREQDSTARLLHNRQFTSTCPSSPSSAVFADTHHSRRRCFQLNVVDAT
jgi:hypothetical protein